MCKNRAEPAPHAWAPMALHRLGWAYTPGRPSCTWRQTNSLWRCVDIGGKADKHIKKATKITTNDTRMATTPTPTAPSATGCAHCGLLRRRRLRWRWRLPDDGTSWERQSCNTHSERAASISAPRSWCDRRDGWDKKRWHDAGDNIGGGQGISSSYMCRG